jgi:regulator of sigma D
MSSKEELKAIWERLRILTKEIINVLKTIENKAIKESCVAFIANAILVSVSESVYEYFELLDSLPKSLNVIVDKMEKMHEKPSGERE